MKIQSKGNKGISPRMARGFSLFEMVIVMGIIGLILGGGDLQHGEDQGLSGRKYFATRHDFVFVGPRSLQKYRGEVSID
ncbi:prepilin-type N-terminal cleavage/methylation domain-containing protein [Akkermansiaceae bacterium]|nr:prepilin-type N-terminal cleavage/methylation domain-containing protein [Akkermansiaceae bacterium]